MKKTTPQLPTVSPLIHHFTVNTGQVATHLLHGMDTLRARKYLPLLARRRGEVPGMPDFNVVLSEGNRSCQFILGYRDRELVTGGLAWGPGDGDNLWRWLGDYYDHIAPWVPGRRTTLPPTPPGMPWVSVLRSLNFGLISREQALKLAVVERDLALALIQHSLTRN
jgi:hypothetical protein